MILAYGMGVDSTAILLHWLENPEARNYKIFNVFKVGNSFRMVLKGKGSFKLKDLVVLTAMTGDEFPDLKELIETHIFPRLRKNGIRYVQIARKSEDEPLVVLDDSRAPRKLHLNGAYKLSDEMLAAGTVPQVAFGKRTCSIKSKGWPLDAWIKQEAQGEPFVEAIGFSRKEEFRLIRDQNYSARRWPEGQKTSIYPLINDWGWTRQDCENYIREVTGVIWPKSACAFCPFTNGKQSVLNRFEKYPDAAAFSMFMERVSVSLNPLMTLYAKEKTLMSVVQGVGDRDALEIFDDMMDRSEWAIYWVRRIYTMKAHADRSVRIMERGNRKAMERALKSYGTLSYEADVPHVYIIRRDWDVYPHPEELFVACPLTMQDKEKDNFQGDWERAVKGDWAFLEERKDQQKKRSPKMSGSEDPESEPSVWGIPDAYNEYPLRLEQEAQEQEDWEREAWEDGFWGNLSPMP
jgi:hypothetical protein